MTTVQISPHIAGREERALFEFTKGRLLLNAQLAEEWQKRAEELAAEIDSQREQIAALEAGIAERDGRIAAFEARLELQSVEVAALRQQLAACDGNAEEVTGDGA